MISEASLPANVLYGYIHVIHGSRPACPLIPPLVFALQFSQGARVSGCQGGRVAGCQGARVPGCQGARVPGHLLAWEGVGDYRCLAIAPNTADLLDSCPGL